MRSLFAVLAVLTLSMPARAGQHHDDSSSPEPEQHHAGAMEGFYGAYDAGREGSGTSWLPDSTPMEGYHFGARGWSFMVHGFANFVQQEESEPRGSSEFFSTNMFMIAAHRVIGDGKLGFRFGASMEPTLGREGYPLLLQTGETADGANPLFDRQHPPRHPHGSGVDL